MGSRKGGGARGTDPASHGGGEAERGGGSHLHRLRPRPWRGRRKERVPPSRKQPRRRPPPKASPSSSSSSSSPASPPFPSFLALRPATPAPPPSHPARRPPPPGETPHPAHPPDFPSGTPFPTPLGPSNSFTGRRPRPNTRATGRRDPVRGPPGGGGPAAPYLSLSPAPGSRRASGARRSPQGPRQSEMAGVGPGILAEAAATAAAAAVAAAAATTTSSSRRRHHGRRRH